MNGEDGAAEADVVVDESNPKVNGDGDDEAAAGLGAGAETGAATGAADAESWPKMTLGPEPPSLNVEGPKFGTPAGGW